MAKIFDKIVQSATEPSKNDIWLKDGQLNAFQNGQWKSLSPQSEGGEGEVSTEHPVRIIEITQEELMSGKQLDITGEEYLKYAYIIICNYGSEKKIFNLDYSYPHIDMGANYYYDIYCSKDRGDYAEVNFCITIDYSNLEDKIHLHPVCPINEKGEINFMLSKNAEINLMLVSECNPNYSYSVILFKDYSTIHGTYYNGTFTAFAEGKLKQYNVNTETGEITEGLSIDLNTLAGLEARIAALEGA